MAKKSKKTKSNFFKSFGTFLKNEKFHKVSGLFFILFSIILAIAFTSYFFTWQADDYIASGDKANNWIGNSGRAISKLFIERWFGIASYVFVLLFFVYGVRLFFKKSIVPLWKTTRISILALIWVSATFGFIFGNLNSLAILGGQFGIYTTGWFEQALGKIGTGILLLFILFSFLIIAYNFSLDFLKPFYPFKKKVNKKSGTTNLPKEDLYNTVEYSVDDEDDDEKIEVSLQTEDSPDNPEPLIIVDSIVDKNNEDSINEDSDVELTIEKPQTNSEVAPNGNNENNDIEHYSVDEPYDPRLDLPHYKFPTLDLLENYGSEKISVQREELEQNKNRIVETLNNYSIQIKKIKATIGPTITLYEIVPVAGVRISKIKNLEDDIALSLSALGIRIIAPIPGKGTIGIEVPNQKPEIVSMRSILSSDKFQNNKYELPFGIGKTIANESYVADLTKMPHLLMAGATGQGKSVGLNAVITSLLYKKHPAELKFDFNSPAL